MKIRVQHPDGRIETIHLRGQLEAVDGQILDKLTDGSLEHFFDHDGYYDGWGGFMPEGSSMEDATAAIEHIDGKCEPQ